MPGCATPRPSPDALLTEDQVIHMIGHPRRWHGRTVTVTIYPYDNGFSASYLVCFEPCDGDYADSSPFIVYTAPDRFRGWAGDRPVVIRARYDASCFYGRPCVHHRYGRLHESAPE